MATRKRPIRLSQASAYYRLAAKAERAGNYKQAGVYRNVANRKVAEERRERERRTRRSNDRGDMDDRTR
jgi:hypothetical protein